jgi:hypothetical protein
MLSRAFYPDLVRGSTVGLALLNTDLETNLSG